MADESGDNWMARLPWVLLGRRTAYQQEVDSTSAELVLGANPTIPGDMVGEPGPPLESKQLRTLLDALRAQAASPAQQMSSHRIPPTNEPSNMDKITHVRVKRHKLGPLQHSYEGPFRIVERMGRSCVKLHVGSYVDGAPRYEIHHWENLKPAVLQDDQKEASRKKLGRKPGPGMRDSLPTDKQSTSAPTKEIDQNVYSDRPKWITRPPARYSA